MAAREDGIEQNANLNNKKCGASAAQCQIKGAQIARLFSLAVHSLSIFPLHGHFLRPLGHLSPCDLFSYYCRLPLHSWRISPSTTVSIFSCTTSSNSYLLSTPTSSFILNTVALNSVALNSSISSKIISSSHFFSDS